MASSVICHSIVYFIIYRMVYAQKKGFGLVFKNLLKSKSYTKMNSKGKVSYSNQPVWFQQEERGSCLAVIAPIKLQMRFRLTWRFALPILDTFGRNHFLNAFWNISLLFLLAFCSMPISSHAERYAAVICGSGGTDEFIEKFSNWGKRLSTLLVKDLGFQSEHVSFFSADITDATDINALPCTVDTLCGYIKDLTATITNQDDLFLFFIGHGSYTENQITIHLPGDDVSAAQLNEWLIDLPANKIVVVNSSSSSAGFINHLSHPNRIICTSTKNVNETNAPEYMEFMIQALQDGSADLNRDERITVYELCYQTAMLTQAWYDQNNYISTEHSLIDDNGDGLGTRLLPEDSAELRNSQTQKTITQVQDGDNAKTFFIKDFQFPIDAPQDLIDRYLSALDHIADFKKKKMELELTSYYQELESLLIHAASLHHQIKSYQNE